MKKTEVETILHNIKSRSLSLKDACELFLECEIEEQREIAKIMQETSKFILEQAEKLTKIVND